ncbi:FAD/NAD(P)-binding protein [Actinoplanes aureus]|uniref:FAD/NAD(P)-binding protein n=1 Tax=Actinoplanes aureus TaxID=2792083 RepID=A0A931C4C7_9ACTN|nr:FAD/NAD(P)-binding protein [Actinoplanes aureus]MBG0560213.1 FAD/NAD(P)-binding protein [Actinoplanes aureus]
MGGGATAVLLLDAIDRAGVRSPLQISVYEPRLVPGPGRPYGEDPDAALINRPADRMSIRHTEPLDFVDWLKAATRQGHVAAVDPEARFQPRWLFGAYLRARLGELLARLAARGVRVEFHRATVDDIIHQDGGFIVATSVTQARAYDAVVLCLGTPRPADPYRLRGLPGFLADPYPLPEHVGTDGPVTVLGTNLTAMDLTTALLRRGRNAPILLMSRRGLVPSVRGPVATAAPEAVEELTRVVRRTPPAGLWSATRRTLRRHLVLRQAELTEVALDLTPGERPADRLRRHLDRVDDPTCWRAGLLTLLDPVGELLWQRLPMVTRRHFLERVNPRVSQVLNPMPPSTAATLLQAVSDGRVEVIAGVTGVTPARDGFVVAAGGRTYRTRTLLNAVRATHYDDGEPPGRLLARLAGRGLARPHPCGGVHIDFDTNRIQGAPDGLYALGHPTAGDVYYANAGSLLGISARAEHIVRDMCPRNTHPPRPGRRRDIRGKPTATSSLGI